jgi:hypothetical protein
MKNAKNPEIKEEKGIKSYSLPVSLIERIEREAKNHKRTASGYLAFILQNYYQQLDEK